MMGDSLGGGASHITSLNQGLDTLGIYICANAPLNYPNFNINEKNDFLTVKYFGQMPYVELVAYL